MGDRIQGSGGLDARKERLALNEALFRTANERAASWEERHGHGDDAELYHCECADLDCREKVALRRADYERVRRDSALFFVVLGHELRDIERVVEEHPEWAVIAKNPETHAIVAELDPRNA